MISEQILKFYLQIFVVSDCDMISSEPCAFVGPFHECTASVASPDMGSGA
ncbi:hypothetical protein SLEP1_g50347 [Rubroshorea leprosula]|uniref:Uncharacterized protein n=1 Tax=Rubroshorea leprosula TaxID=152421 RepID=A0AAV5LZT9_9ROSI|nr:hypothetical protein SLEP1_g50347 [Rubroshorea leprosula]